MVTAARFDTEHLQELFNGFCQQSAIVKLSREKEARRIAAEDMCLCVHHLLYVTQRRLMEGLDSVNILEMVQQIVTQMDNITEYEDSLSHELLHVWLEVRWILMEIVSLIPLQQQERLESLLLVPSMTPSSSWTDQLVSASCLDLLHLANQRYSSLEISHKNLTQISIFTCPRDCCPRDFPAASTRVPDVPVTKVEDLWTDVPVYRSPKPEIGKSSGDKGARETRERGSGAEAPLSTDDFPS